MADGEPPDPTAFYNVVEYENSPLPSSSSGSTRPLSSSQRTSHWHDWEVCTVRRHEGRATRNCASPLPLPERARDEFLDPDPDGPRILSVGHTPARCRSTTLATGSLGCRRETGCGCHEQRGRSHRGPRGDSSPPGSRATRARDFPISSRSTRAHRCTNTSGSRRSAVRTSSRSRSPSVRSIASPNRRRTCRRGRRGSSSSTPTGATATQTSSTTSAEQRTGTYADFTAR